MPFPYPQGDLSTAPTNLNCRWTIGSALTGENPPIERRCIKEKKRKGKEKERKGKENKFASQKERKQVVAIKAEYHDFQYMDSRVHVAHQIGGRIVWS